MFCCDCGSSNPGTANYRHKCGGILYKSAAEFQKRIIPSNERELEPRLTQEQRQFVDALLSIDNKPHECHACGRTEDLNRWDFGLAKETGTKRDWSMTAWSVVVSAVMLPLLGAGSLELPGKSTHFNVLRLQLVLCKV